MNANRIKVLLDEAANDGIPEGIDLWPAIRSHVQLSRRAAHGPATNHHRGLMLGAVVLAVAVVLAAAPPTRTLLGSGMQRFGTILVQSGLIPGSSQPLSSASPDVQPLTPVSLEEARQRVDFSIPTPTWLPAGVVFRNAFVSSDNETVVLSYQLSGDPSKGLFIQIKKGQAAGGYVIPSSASQNVTVDGHPAVYAGGAWDSSGKWNGVANAGLLSWQDNGFTYVLSFSGLALTRADMIRIADSIR
jgi:Domain of unknown function (DUF4367)